MESTSLEEVTTSENTVTSLALPVNGSRPGTPVMQGASRLPRRITSLSSLKTSPSLLPRPSSSLQTRRAPSALAIARSAGQTPPRIRHVASVSHLRRRSPSPTSTTDSEHDDDDEDDGRSTGAMTPFSLSCAAEQRLRVAQKRLHAMNARLEQARSTLFVPTGERMRSVSANGAMEIGNGSRPSSAGAGMRGSLRLRSVTEATGVDEISGDTTPKAVTGKSEGTTPEDMRRLAGDLRNLRERMLSGSRRLSAAPICPSSPARSSTASPTPNVLSPTVSGRRSSLSPLAPAPRRPGTASPTQRVLSPPGRLMSASPLIGARSTSLSSASSQNSTPRRPSLIHRTSSGSTIPLSRRNSSSPSLLIHPRSAEGTPRRPSSQSQTKNGNGNDDLLNLFPAPPPMRRGDSAVSTMSAATSTRSEYFTPTDEYPSPSFESLLAPTSTHAPRRPGGSDEGYDSVPPTPQTLPGLPSSSTSELEGPLKALLARVEEASEVVEDGGRELVERLVEAVNVCVLEESGEVRRRVGRVIEVLEGGQ
ncbi:hypothetical protein SAICODRAFT_21595 [Saitoella complicata NRRL Y-17804]|uniref:uncharacterized protein n=1 Tax=Saitoella complicata (strain BCRC 22490 / CBS 7301 / JCM 7358 / NBRC 10748 / NRRL Y-17804) TaxID=698492 RepID=UPI0008672531|nr:uncharacterized protein SAICODRAFT_21595 [Saitoella complicata NRRL Y-17804]ODQ50348.1 hypothetical protein SAICODRAFT_21595 [Saitoella complicata NRRL Y-17804]